MIILYAPGALQKVCNSQYAYENNGKVTILYVPKALQKVEILEYACKNNV